MKLQIREDMFESLPARLFFEILAEMINKNDELKNADDYIDNFDKSKKREYVNQYPISEIKDDLLRFVQEWSDEMKQMNGVYNVNARMSGSYGFSNYVTFSFERPKDRRLRDFYEQNKNLYNNVKFRFSEHTSRNDDSDIEDNVYLIGKTFNQAADEMKYKVMNYVTDLHAKEKQYLKKLDKQNKKRR